jgi:hypothetical protein
VRLRGRRGALARDELLASDAWKTCQESLARCAAPPKLSLV